MNCSGPRRPSFWNRLGQLFDQFAAGFGSYDFEIRFRPGSPARLRGRIPASKAGIIREFFARDLNLNRPVIVRGTWVQGRNLHLQFLGNLSEGSRQRTRNFLLECLR